MIIKKIVSKSKDGMRMEVIATENKNPKTVHVRKNDKGKWMYFAGINANGKVILKTIREKKDGTKV